MDMYTHEYKQIHRNTHLLFINAFMLYAILHLLTYLWDRHIKIHKYKNKYIHRYANTPKPKQIHNPTNPQTQRHANTQAHKPKTTTSTH